MFEYESAWPTGGASLPPNIS